ncbi:serine/threonine-protein kinase [Aliikangiella coralliicola]|uniref:Protein kinase n=1 Tax=Aliikangiella coralliicola TaxID=2592383 RepID=A0A545UJY6_9GAMM|nr:protein kinase [Aliikangiella coralliicola]TQV89778.1 protein kinase [Aliikangiella coralliicola]
MGFPILAGYKINQELASGGMAKIYDAIQVSLNRPVAIKFLSKKLLTHPEAKKLFERESLIIAQLNHPNIVQVIDKGITDDSQPFFVMEKIKGIDLSYMLSGGELPLGKKLDIAIQLCRGLAYAHKNGVIHRDIKPSNIIIDQHGNVRILDFGIAIAEEPVNPRKSNRDRDAANESQTSVMGTEGYVAPEQEADYSKATFASDIYSVGILFYDLFGKPCTTTDKKSRDRLENQLPDELVNMIEKCCHDSAAKRYQSLSEVRDKLLGISQGSHLGKTNIKELEQENKDLTSNFNLLDVLSKTHGKRVYLFQKKSNRQLFVIKRTIGDTSGLKEAKYLSSLKHPNILNVFAAVKSQSNVTIISEYLSGGSLSNQLIQDMNEQSFLVQACQICSALYFAHQNNILHRNLSPNNILFDAKQNLKLSDFGQAASSNDDPQAIRAYQPPGNQAFSEKYDIYCMGAIFHHMLYGVPPATPLPSPTKKVSIRLEKLIDNMIAIDPLHRPSSAQQILVELQRIASNSSNKQFRSNMGKSTKQDTVEPRVRRLSQTRHKKDHTVWLSIALAIAILCIIGLLIKDFVK